MQTANQSATVVLLYCKKGKISKSRRKIESAHLAQETATRSVFTVRKLRKFHSANSEMVKKSGVKTKTPKKNWADARFHRQQANSTDASSFLFRGVLSRRLNVDGFSAVSACTFSFCVWDGKVCRVFGIFFSGMDSN